MNTILRALLRVCLLAAALLVMSYLHIFGVAVHGSPVNALAVVVAFEITLWLSLLVYAGAFRATAGRSVQKAPRWLNTLVFLAVASAFLLAAGSYRPDLITVSGVLSAIGTGFVFMVISAVVMWRRPTCACEHEAEESTHEDE